MYVRIDDAQVSRFAAEVAKLPSDAKGLDFYRTFDGKAHDAEMYPPLQHGSAIDFFFFICLHNHGFWHGDRQGYRAPMFATLGGKRLKGSDALWRTLIKTLDRTRGSLHPQYLSGVTEADLTENLFVHDDGPLPLPDPATRIEMTRAYGSWFVLNARRGKTPASIVEAANAEAAPLAAFLEEVSWIPGFDRDPFQKKARLLAMALMNRPEAFLKPAPGEQLGPIVDYHLMRVALRLGLVVLDARYPNLVKKNVARQWVRPVIEEKIRAAVHEALVRVQTLSGVSSATLDLAMWSARKFCPEMTEPECGKCRFQDACAKRTELFQPVYRTTAY
jgi:hypothetical protein